MPQKVYVVLVLEPDAWEVEVFHSFHDAITFAESQWPFISPEGRPFPAISDIQFTTSEGARKLWIAYGDNEFSEIRIRESEIHPRGSKGWEPRAPKGR